MSRVLCAEGIDSGAVWHLGDPFAEQRKLVSGAARVCLRHYDQVRISGPERLSWLHVLTSQAFTDLAPGVWTDALMLDAHGKIRWGFSGVDDGAEFRLHTGPGQGAGLLAHLERMIFRTQVEVAAVTGPLSWGSDGYAFTDPAPDAEAGMWAFEALRIAAGVPRPGLDTDERTIPNELGLWATALGKGCYPGQETVARTHTLGRPPRRLIRLLLDGSEDRLPTLGAALAVEGKDLGRVGSSAQHWELGPIGLGLIKRNVAVDSVVMSDGIAATQEALVDPDVGLHVRPRL